MALLPLQARMGCVYEGCELRVRVKSGKNLAELFFGRGLGLEKPVCCSRTR